jgi:hypothetical protein
MPVEILELIVRAHVQESSQGGTEFAGDEGDTGEFQKQQLIEECVEQVLEILRRQQER